MKDPFFRTRIRFDGLTRPGDIRLAGELGVDAIGFDFARDARCQLRVEDARFMRQALAPLVASVAIFRDNCVEDVREIVRLLRPSLIEFHGGEDDMRMRSFGVPYARALHPDVWATMNAATIHARYPNAAVFVLHANEVEGGANDWSWMPPGLGKPVMLAGGIAADNVSRIIGTLEPWGVSALSGIEFVPGRVDGDRMRRFLREARGGVERR
ncbi:MAG: N-(5'-phosphoribosyl)anthranilate isomerase [Proteobacteria bacterium]|nr:N-(5'-phosphoribosyl)anthranilate isomerase [Pseudomonadota bacterium]